MLGHVDDPRVEKLAARGAGEMPLDARPDLAYGLLPAAAGEQRSQDTPRIPGLRSLTLLQTPRGAAT